MENSKRYPYIIMIVVNTNAKQKNVHRTIYDTWKTNSEPYKIQFSQISESILLFSNVGT